MYPVAQSMAMVKHEPASVVHARLTPRQQIGMGLPWASGSVALALSVVILTHGAHGLLVTATFFILLLARFGSEACLKE
jgi:hypothetical protein